MSWLVPTLWVALVGAIVVAFAIRNTRRQIARTLGKRPNLTREQFLVQMGPGVSRDAAEFLWDTALFYLEPKLAPHPDDDLVKDLPIDNEDWSVDWPREYANRQGFHDSNLPDWPEGWPVTIRNYGRWLTMGRVI